jgi:glycosyltransferase involved in cell wall biosynthesis
MLKSGRVPRQPDVVVVSGVHLARLLGLYAADTVKILDAPRLGSAAHRSHAEQGRAEDLALFRDASQEARLLQAAGTVLVTSSQDAVLVRLGGHTGDLILAPPTGWLPDGSPAVAANRAPPAGPRLLFVGSETTVNLDAVRWFRQSVLPRVVEAVPSARLRIVGEVARHVDPDPSTERLGWVDDLELEYEQASAVVLPLRMGSGVRRRAVEALVRGKALCTTPAGSYGLRLASGRHALVVDDAGAMADSLIRVLQSDSDRHRLEDGAAAFASTHLDRDQAFRPLGEFLGLPDPEDYELELAAGSTVETPTP